MVLGSKKTRAYTSIRIDPELWKEFKIEALRQDVEVSELMERLVRRELERAKSK